MGFTKYTTQTEKTAARMNDAIRVKEVRVIGPEGENFGVLATSEALARARAAGLDLIEVSAQANPPVCRITDYGKFKYEQRKKEKEIKSRSVGPQETKEAQVKIGTSENDMKIKAKKIAEWLREGQRVKIDLFLWGRYKYMEFDFLKDRLERFLAIITEAYKVAEEIRKSPKGLSIVIEPDSGKGRMQKKPAPAAAPAEVEVAS